MPISTIISQELLDVYRAIRLERYTEPEPQPAENWVHSPALPVSYWVSDLGRVRCVWGAKDKIVDIRVGTNGYRTFLCRPRLNPRGRRTPQTVYTHVMLAFNGPTPEGMWTVHKDGDKLNDRLDNLAFVPKGRRWYGVKGLELRSVRDCLREQFAAGDTLVELAQHYDIPVGDVYKVIKTDG